MNNIKITGNIGKEPELRYTPEGKAVLSFRVSLYTGGSKENGYKPSVWVGVTMWEDKAVEMNDQLHAGEKVTVYGMTKPPRTYKNSDGQEVPAGLEVTASVIEKGNGFEETF